MIFTHTYSQTQFIENQLQEFITLNQTFKSTPISSVHADLIRSKSTLSSSLFSAKIEGNPLTATEINSHSTTVHQLEVQNLNQTLNWINHQSQIIINQSLVINLHHKVMNRIISEAGVLRHEQSAIYNQSGIAVYITPPPQEIPSLLNLYLQTQSQANYHPLIKSIISHYHFEKIHPFIDGNGRVGRLLLHCQLKQINLNLNGLFTYEKYIDDHKSEYYYLLDQSTIDLSDWIKFFLNGFIKSANLTLSEINHLSSHPNQPYLLPRRQEILDIIKDHRQVSFDMIHRRFINVPPSTLRYDLLKLQQAKLIKKLGVTNGALYEPNL